MLGHQDMHVQDHRLRNQTLRIDGPIVASPPFNVHDFCFGGTCASDQSLSLHATDYKQVGAFFWQTDGLFPYPNSRIEKSFFHVNDDGFKLYYSGAQISNVSVVWNWATTRTCSRSTIGRAIRGPLLLHTVSHTLRSSPVIQSVVLLSPTCHRRNVHKKCFWVKHEARTCRRSRSARI